MAATIIPFDDLRSSPTAVLFEGGELAGPDISIFFVTTPPGKGPGRHVHPYPEVFLVQKGQARFIVGEEFVAVSGGNVVMVPAETIHGFTNVGDEPLSVVSVHPSPVVIQTWLDE